MADREFLIKIVGDVSNAQKSIGTLEKDVGGFKKTAGGIGKAVLSGIAVGAVVQAGKTVVSSASDQEQAIGALHSVFGDYSDEMDAFGKTTAENMGISRSEFSQLGAVTGAMLKNAGVPLNEMASSTQDLTGRAADMAAMFGGTVPDAMAAINSALKGERDPIEKYGISIKESAVQAKALEMGLVDSQGKVTDYGKAMATQALIMEQSADAAGTFSKESGTLAGQQAIMSAQFKDTQAQIGQALLPVVVRFADVLKGLITFVKNNTSWLIPLAGAIVGVGLAIKGWRVATEAWSIATKIATGIQWLFNAAMNANPISLIVIGVAALVAGFVLLYTKVDWFRNAVDATLGFVLDLFKNLLGWVQDNWPILLAVLTGPIGAAVVVIVKNWDKIKEAVATAFNWVKANWPLILAIITGPIGLAVLAIQRNWDSIRNGAQALFDGVKRILSTVWDAISYPFKQGTDLAKAALDSIVTVAGSIGGKITGALSGVANAIKYPFNVAFNAIKSLWNSTVGGFGFSVPSWVPIAGGKSFKIPRMATGGIVTRPTLAIIGEAGPEAVVPLGSGGFGGVVINVYALTANAEVGRKVYEALREYERVTGKAIA